MIENLRFEFKLEQPKRQFRNETSLSPVPTRKGNKHEFRELSMRDFELGKLVGSGKFGDVHICRHKPTGFLLALKKVFKSTIKEYGMVEQFAK